MEVLNIWDQHSLEMTRFYKNDRTSSKHRRPYQILSRRRPHNLACTYCAVIITFIITPINYITITFNIITFNSVVSK